MWKDPEDHWSTVATNSLAAHLMPGGHQDFADPVGPADRDLDINEATQNLPLAADLTQARIVTDAVAGRSLAIEEPPGMSKSQTISNLIFRALATGRITIFVTEKKSTLNVVTCRLREEAGIGALLLNLHDNGVEPTKVRRALRRVLALWRGECGDGAGSDVDAGDVADHSGPAALRVELARVRAELDTYREDLYKPAPDGPSYSGVREVLAQLGNSEDPADPAATQATLKERARAIGLDIFDVNVHSRLIEHYRNTLEELRAALTPESLDVVPTHHDQVLRDAPVRIEALRSELNRRHSAMSVRKLIRTYDDLITALALCLLASPDSVTRFFPADHRYVDIAVFDEASQIRATDAVGTMGRGRSAVVVGDPKQIPPALGAGNIRGE